MTYLLAATLVYSQLDEEHGRPLQWKAEYHDSCQMYSRVWAFLPY